MTEAVETVVSKPEIAPELLQLKDALKNIGGTFQLLNVVSFPRNSFQAVVDCQNFLMQLHAQFLDKAVAHPDCDKDAELKALKEQKDGESKPEKTV